MGKRLRRIFQQQLTEQMPNLQGKVASVVTADSRTVRGTIVELQNGRLILLDMSRQRHAFLLKEVVEVVLDFEAAY